MSMCVSVLIFVIVSFYILYLYDQFCHQSIIYLKYIFTTEWKKGMKPCCRHYCTNNLLPYDKQFTVPLLHPRFKLNHQYVMSSLPAMQQTCFDCTVPFLPRPLCVQVGDVSEGSKQVQVRREIGWDQSQHTAITSSEREKANGTHRLQASSGCTRLYNRSVSRPKMSKRREGPLR